MVIKAVIFDLDGTITVPFFDFDSIRHEMGLGSDSGPIWEAMAKMKPKQRLTAELILHYHERLAVEKSTLNTGAQETLTELRRAGIGIGILTRNLKANALAVAEKHKLQFDVVVDRHDGPVKPDAFGVLEICRQLNVTPAETILVGDYLFDLLSARAAGADAVLLNNHTDADEFAQHADFVIETIDEVLQIVEDKNGK